MERSGRCRPDRAVGGGTPNLRRAASSRRYPPPDPASAVRVDLNARGDERKDELGCSGWIWQILLARDARHWPHSEFLLCRGAHFQRRNAVPCPAPADTITMVDSKYYGENLALSCLAHAAYTFNGGNFWPTVGHERQASQVVCVYRDGFWVHAEHWRGETQHEGCCCHYLPEREFEAFVVEQFRQVHPTVHYPPPCQNRYDYSYRKWTYSCSDEIENMLAGRPSWGPSARKR